MAIKVTFNGETDAFDNKLRTYLMDSGDTTDDLPTKDDTKGVVDPIARKAIAGETAIGADGTVYMYFETAGWTEV